MKQVEIEVKVGILRKELAYWEGILANKGCKDCMEFQQGRCRLAGGAVPPPEVQQTGCPEWQWDDIPF